MSIKIKCPGCSVTLALKETLFNNKGEFVIACPNCSKKIKIKGAKDNKSSATDNTEAKTQIFKTLPKETQYTLKHIGSNQAFPLNESYVIFGRASNNNEVRLQFVTNDSSISRKHCIFRKYSDGVTIEDISKGGTLVNGKRLKNLEEKYLYSNTKITIGSQEFSVLIKN